MWIWPFLPIPTIWNDCVTETQQIQYLKNSNDELEKRVAALEKKVGISAVDAYDVDTSQKS